MTQNTLNTLGALSMGASVNRSLQAVGILPSSASIAVQGQTEQAAMSAPAPVTDSAPTTTSSDWFLPAIIGGIIAFFVTPKRKG